jgi:hypothetical protein
MCAFKGDNFKIQPASGVSEDLLKSLTGPGQFLTHAHNPTLPALLTKVFKWKGAAYLITENNTPIAYLPCMLIRDRLVSMPHFSFGGLITKRVDPEVIYTETLPLIIQELCGSKSISGKSAVKYLIRSQSGFGSFATADKVVSYISLENKDIAAMVPARQLRKALKSEEAGCTIKQGGKEFLADFYLVYSRNMLHLGSPVLPFRFFELLIDEYSDGHHLFFCVYRNGKPVGASFLISYAGFFENTWFSTQTESNSYFPSYLLHREMIRFSIENGGHTYSFGRSSLDSGVHEFKRRWGTSDSITFWNYSSRPALNVRKMNVLSNMWKLMPPKVANKLGPFLSKDFY